MSLGDTLTVTLAKEDSLTSDSSSVPQNHSNLILQAARLFRMQTGLDVHAHFDLKKRVPVQAGLGGGSSNAATALWALNALSGLNASDENLAQWLSQISSDAPFFFSQGTAYCTGRGERMTSLKCPQVSFPKWIAKPEGGLATPDVYRHCEPHRYLNEDPLVLLENFLGGVPRFINDLEHPAFALMPSLKLLKESLLQMGFQTVMMTGSGSAFFCAGTVESPQMAGVTFYPVEFLSRKEGQWYNSPEFSIM